MRVHGRRAAVPGLRLRLADPIIPDGAPACRASSSARLHRFPSRLGVVVSALAPVGRTHRARELSVWIRDLGRRRPRSSGCRIVIVRSAGRPTAPASRPTSPRPPPASASAAASTSCASNRRRASSAASADAADRWSRATPSDGRVFAPAGNFDADPGRAPRRAHLRRHRIAPWHEITRLAAALRHLPARYRRARSSPDRAARRRCRADPRQLPMRHRRLRVQRRRR